MNCVKESRDLFQIFPIIPKSVDELCCLLLRYRSNLSFIDLNDKDDNHLILCRIIILQYGFLTSTYISKVIPNIPKIFSIRSQ